MTNRTLEGPSHKHLGAYATQPTMTLAELIHMLNTMAEILGPDHQVRVDSFYDQGQPAMPITGVCTRNGYVAIEA